MKPWLRTVLIVIFTAVFLGSAVMLANYYYNSHKSKDQFSALAQLVQQTATEPDAAPTQPAESPDAAVPAVTEPVILPEYAELFNLNPDTVGWLQIDGTDINYPVMQTPSDPDLYLHTDFYGNYSAHGCLYARDVCDVFAPSDNITIYGHNMKDGSMFADLTNYRSESFFLDHPCIIFNTLYEHHTYEVFAVFKTTATLNQGFSYHRFVDARDAAQFDDFVNTCRELAFYDTGIVPQYGDKLITLSTCEYTLKNGRLVVVARQID